MDLKAIASMEAAGDVAGLVRVLKDIRTHTEGGEVQGDQARNIMEDMGFNIHEGASANIVDMNQMRVVDDSAHVRAEVARALGRLNLPEGNNALVETLNDDTLRVSRAVAEALCQVGGKKMQSALSGFEKKSGFGRFDAIGEATRIMKG